MSCEYAETTTLLWLYGEADEAHAEHVAGCAECTAVAEMHADTGSMVAPILPVLRRPHGEAVASSVPQPANSARWLLPFIAGAAASAAVLLGLGGLPGAAHDPVGDTVAQIHATPSDVVLTVYLQASVPTSGRQALKATAMVVRVITGIPIHISTSQAEIRLMLIDAETGTVLWYDRYLTETDVRKDRSLRRLVKRITKYLLEPRKK